MFTKIPATTYVTPSEAQKIYGMDTGGAERSLLGALIVHNGHVVADILKIANEQGLKLWPISGGRNFGYGTALPVLDNCLILDLSQLKRIEFFKESQTFQLEPGVTQEDLANFLDEHRLPYLVPTTGLGPTGSIIGNALDGGYGLTPMTDHFDALTDVRGYWGTGEPFEPSHASMGCADMARRWSAGTGPNVMGLLRQGNFGIVTKAVVRLTRTPEAARIIVMEWTSNASFYASQDGLSKLTEEFPMLSGVICMNAARVLSTQAGAPLSHPSKGDKRQQYLNEMCAKRKVRAWTGVGTAYGTSASLKGLTATLTKRFPGVRVWVFDPADVRLFKWLLKGIPSSWFPATRRQLDSLVNMLHTLEGRPVAAFLRLAYALTPTPPEMTAARHPANDGQGILWYAPLIPITAEAVEQYVKETSRILEKYGFDPLLAVTTRSSRVHTGTIPLIFLKAPLEIERARACYRELVRHGIEHNRPPYRIGVEFMDLTYAPQGSPSANLWRNLKSVLDPNDVVSPGRYVPRMDVTDE